MPHHRTQEALQKEIKEAEKLVKPGELYSHYKHPENLYKVIAIATQEATDKLCVIYQAEYGKKLIFVRDLDSWLEKIKIEEKTIPRFKLIT